MQRSTKKSRRHRNPKISDENKGPFFSKNLDDNPVPKVQQPFFQTKLQISQPNDQYEREADAVADRVTSSNRNGKKNPEKISKVQPGSLKSAQMKIQRKAELEGSSLQMQGKEEEEPVQMVEEEEDTMQMQEEEIQTKGEEVEDVQMQEEEEEEVQMQEEKEEVVQMQEEEEEPIQMKEGEEEEEVQMQEEEEEVQMQEEEEEPLQMKKEAVPHASGKTLSNRIGEKAGRGRSLPRKTKVEMESAFGVDFSKVNIHTDTYAVQMNKELGAQAFTHGKNIYFNSGKYRPESSAGKRLLAHELTHVVQQGGGKKTPDIQRQPTPPATLTAARFQNHPELLAALQRKRYIKKGAKGGYVSVLQKALIDDGFSLPKYGVDGDFGNETKNAVLNYQIKHNLKQDGIVGPETMGHLDSNFAKTIITDRYSRWYDEQIKLYKKEGQFPYHVAVMNVFYKTRNFHVIQILNDIKYEVYTFTGAKDTWKYKDGRIEVKDLSNSLRGNTDRENKIIRLNFKSKPLDAAMTLYHEMNHVTSKEPDFLEQEIESRIVTEQFAIDNNLPPTRKEYRTKDGQVDKEFIRQEIKNSQHYNPTDKIRIGRSYEGMNKIGPWTLPI